MYIYEIIRLVGYENYKKSLTLNGKFELFDYVVKPHLIEYNFTYNETPIYLYISDTREIINTKCCICNSKICSHMALVLDYIFSNSEQLDRLIAESREMYDENYNDYFFSLLEQTNYNKKKLNTEITLKYIEEDICELQLKIGEKRKYLIKKNIEQFLDTYNDISGQKEIIFGKELVYSNKYYYFADEDKEIIEFIESYINSQIKERHVYSKIKGIFLTGQTLKQLLKLLENRNFKLDYNRIKTDNKTIKKSKLSIKLKDNNDQIEINFDNKIIPLTKDYEYIIDNNIIYKLNDDIRKILEIMLITKHRKLIFKEREYEKFSSLILPKINDENITLPPTLEKKFVITNLAPNYYFEKSSNGINGTIKLVAKDISFDILDENCKLNDKFITRDNVLEKEYIKELLDFGFIIKNKKFKLTNEEDTLYFINEGLKQITNKYTVFVADNIKKIKIHKNTSVTSNFSIGRDNILKYDFSVENIDKAEISKLLDAVKYKKKFLKLKNGDFISLQDNNQLDDFYNIIDSLGISNKEVTNKQLILPKYKSLHINNLRNNYNFIEVDKNFENLITNFNKYKNMKINLSKEDLDILRDYQEIGIKWMCMLSACGFGGILADEMGLGKSIQTIKYIKLKVTTKKNKKFLIVSPTSLIYNWEEEFNKFGQTVKVCIINDLKGQRLEKLKEIDKYDVIITTYGLLRQDILEYKKISFDTFIIDEAQNIKNVNSGIAKVVKEISAPTKFALTGTPLENSIIELWSIFDFIMPGYLPNLNNFKKIYNSKAIEEGNFTDLNLQIAPFILRRKKKDVIGELPDKQENLVIVEMTDEQKKYYLAQLELTKQEIDNTISNNTYMKSQIIILSLLTKLRQLCIDPHLLIDDYKGNSSKFEATLDILEEVISNNHKVLLFSQYPSALKLFIPHLGKKGITFCYLDCSTKSKDRMNLVNKFNNDLTNVFLISLKAGGTGLNLTSADIVIHLDPWWNPAVENQATDRAHRIGQVNKVEVIKLVCKGTIEEKIVELQRKKQHLSDQIIEGEKRDDIVLSKLSEQDLRKILEV
ncbi:MAG: DEAD/DEAH box helicase [Bacilli bacterium]